LADRYPGDEGGGDRARAGRAGLHGHHARRQGAVGHPALPAPHRHRRSCDPEGRRQRSGRQVAARRVHPQGAGRAVARGRQRLVRPLIDLWVGAQTWVFEAFVSPLLYALDLMEWYEPALNAVEFVMLGLVQIALIALVMRPIERRYGIEKGGLERGEEGLVG